MENARLKFVEGGIEVYPSERAKLPGLYMNVLQAERAVEKYRAEGRAVKAKKGKRNG